MKKNKLGVAKRVSLIDRIFRFRSKMDHSLNTGTAEHLDIPPGSHYFVCYGHVRVILIDTDNKPRLTYILKEGRHRITVHADVLVTVQCANDVQWIIESAQVAELVDQTRIEVPIEISSSNKAHTDLRYMIDRFMRGGIQINRQPVPEESDADRQNFGSEDHVYSRYEQRAFEEDNPPHAESAKPLNPSPAPAGSPPSESPTPSSS